MSLLPITPARGRDGQPIVRLEVLLKSLATVDYSRSERGLEMRIFQTSGQASGAVQPLVKSSPTVSNHPAAARANP